MLDEARWEPVFEIVQRATGDAGRAAFARSGGSRLQSEVLRRSAFPRRGLSPGHSLGLADRAIHRRLAARCIPTIAKARRKFLEGFVTLWTRRCRIDQRDLRRRVALYTARLHRASLERRGSSAVLGKDGGVNGVAFTPLGVRFSVEASLRIHGRQPSSEHAVQLFFPDRFRQESIHARGGRKQFFLIRRACGKAMIGRDPFGD